MIYLDYAATTPVRPEVVSLIAEALEEDYGNPSSIHQMGKHSKVRLIQARKTLAELVGVAPSQLYFTSGATEANNWALSSQAARARSLGYGHHIVATAIEHPSVVKTLVALENQGFEVTYLRPQVDGTFDVDQFLAASREETMGWVAMAVNNEVGSVLPIQALGTAAKEQHYWMHVDTVQIMGHPEMLQATAYATSFVASAHKFGGPKGVGFLAYQPWDKAMILSPFLHGGGQEQWKRPGTENLPYILGMAKALEVTLQAAEDQSVAMRAYSEIILTALDQAGIPYALNGDSHHRSSHILNLWFPGFNADRLLMKLDMARFCVSAGSACSAGTLSDSPILQAYYPDQSDRSHQSLRISFGYRTQKAEVEQFTNVLITILKGK